MDLARARTLCILEKAVDDGRARACQPDMEKSVIAALCKDDFAYFNLFIWCPTGVGLSKNENETHLIGLLHGYL